MAAGIEISLTTDDQAIGRALTALVAQGRRPPMGEIGATLVLSTRQRIREQVSPERKPWEPLSARYQRRKVGSVGRRRGPKHILRQTRRLYNSIGHLADDDEVAVGSGHKLAPIHQLGGTEDMAPGPAAIPARPFLGISDEDEGDIAAILLDHLGEAFD